MDFRVKDFKFRDITNFVNFGKIFFKFVTKIIKIQKFCVQIGNFCVRVKDFKFWSFRVKAFQFSRLEIKFSQKSQNFDPKKFLMITNFVGSRWHFPKASNLRHLNLERLRSSDATCTCDRPRCILIWQIIDSNFGDQKLAQYRKILRKILLQNLDQNSSDAESQKFVDSKSFSDDDVRV